VERKATDQQERHDGAFKGMRMNFFLGAACAAGPSHVSGETHRIIL